MQLHEQFRPKSWDEVIGQDKVIAVINRLRARGLGGRAYWITGKSGCGKTTTGRLLAAEIADEWGTEEIDAVGLSAAAIADWETKSRYKAIGGHGWAFIVNEAHGLSRPAIRQLLVTLERVPDNAAWIFTTTNDGQENLFGDNEDAHPLLSRCTVLQLASNGLAPLFAKRAREIAQSLDLDGKPEAAYLRLVQEHRNNFRAVLQAIEAGKMAD